VDSTITGKVGPRWVEAVIADGVQPLLALDLADGSHLSATPNHLFYVDGGPGIAKPEWLAAGDLQVGDRLRTKDAKGTTVLRVRYHTGYAQVYTLTVAADHDFFVGPDAVLVHNCPKVNANPEHDAEFWAPTNTDVSQRSIDVYNQVLKDNFAAPDGVYSGGTYTNGNHQLDQFNPSKAPTNYVEYDIHPSSGVSDPNRNRDERIVIDTLTGRAFYTKDHYTSFVEISGFRQ